MSAASVVLEPREESTLVQKAVTHPRLVVEEKEEKTDRDHLIVVAAIILAFTFTAVVMGTILLTLALRGSG